MKLLLSILFSYCFLNVNAQKNLVHNGNFEDGLTDWRNNGDVQITPWVVYQGKGALAIVALQNKGWVGTDQTVSVPKNSQALQVSFWVNATNIVKGKNDWNTGVVIAEFLKKGQKIGSDISIANIDGDVSWKEFEKKIPIPEGATELKIMIAMSECTGTLCVDNVKVITTDLSKEIKQ